MMVMKASGRASVFKSILVRENRNLKRLQPPGGCEEGYYIFRVRCAALRCVVAPCGRARARTTRGRGLAIGMGVDGCPET